MLLERRGARRTAAAVLMALAALLVLALPRTASAATYVTQDGYTVNVEAPNLAADPARDQSFVDLLGSLVHFTELSGITVHLAADQAELGEWCGPTAAACVTGSTIHTRGWITAADQRTVLAHEYGHIIHSARDNPPWGSIRAGTKRWATYEGICQGLRSGEYGDFSYQTTPREAFAQAYATLNFPDAPWSFIESLRPDEGALEAIREDVLDPWEPTVETIKGRLGKSGKVTHELALPLDGVLSATLKTAKRLKAKLALIVGGAKVRRGGLLEYEICGERAASLQVKARRHTRGKYKLNVERP